MRWLWFGLGFGVVAIVLLAQWPATMTARWIHRHADVSLVAPTGTVWQGAADSLQFQGRDLGRMNWRLSPWSLLRLRPRAQVRLVGADHELTARVIRESAGRLALEQVQATIPGQWLQPILVDTRLGFGGQVQAELGRVAFDRAGFLDEIVGQGVWRDAEVHGAIVVALGDLRVTWRTPAPGRMVGELDDAGGPLELGGRVSIEDRGYRLLARLRSRGHNPALRNTLYSLARPDAEGWVTLQWTGPLVPLRT